MLENLPLPEPIRNVLSAALQAVDPYQAVVRALTAPDKATQQALASAQRWIVVALGKAAFPMAKAAADILGERIARGVVVTKRGHASGEIPRFRMIEAGHPVPDAGSRRGAAAILAAVEDAGPADAVLVLISGGGSALATAPRLPLTLADLQRTTQLLLASGATIEEVNTVRKHLDSIKGGGLAKAAAPAQVVTLVLSDVLGDPLDAIASGPTVPDPTTFADAWQVLTRYHLTERLPSRVRALLQSGLRGEIPETPKPGDPVFARVHHRVVGNLRLAAEAALQGARAEGFAAEIATTTLQGEAREVGRVLAAVLQEMAQHQHPLPRPACLIWGGETTVTLGEQYGLGGRNQELALAAVRPLAGLQEVWLVAFATDGTDGPTDAAGAVATGETWQRACSLGLSPAEALARHDAYPFWMQVGGLLRSGPTQTNVNDLILLVAGLPQQT